MRIKKRKLGATGFTFLALLGGVATTIITTPLVSCNSNKDYYGKQKAVIVDSYSSQISISEQKTLDNGDMQITAKLTDNQMFLKSATIVANTNLKETEYKVSSVDSTITIYSSALKTYKNVEKFTIVPLLNYKSIELDKTSIELGINETTTLKVTLADGATKEINGEIKGDGLCIKIEKGEDDNTLKITGLKSNTTKTTYIYFTCDGYKSNACEIKVVSKKDKFVTKADEFSDTFNEAKTKYEIGNISVYNETDKQMATINELQYEDDGLGNRICNLTVDGNIIIIANINIYGGQALKDDSKDETESGVTYSISDDEITYHDNDSKETSDISINKNGYATKLAYNDGENTKVYKVTYTGNPQ